MNKYDPREHHRRSVRLRGYDYSQPGAYFVTLCTARRRPVFGRIEENQMVANIYGDIVEEGWQALPLRFDHLTLDGFVVMPNHVHAICLLSPPPSPRTPEPLAQIIAYWKYDATKRINIWRKAKGLAPVLVWQRSFHDRIIRDERELNIKRRYIIENPLHWDHDEENPTRHPQPHPHP